MTLDEAQKKARRASVLFRAAEAEFNQHWVAYPRAWPLYSAAFAERAAIEAAGYLTETDRTGLVTIKA